MVVVVVLMTMMMMIIMMMMMMMMIPVRTSWVCSSLLEILQQKQTNKHL
jgi:hypothetical protein